MSTNDLSEEDITRAIQKKYPNLTRSDAIQLTSKIFLTIRERLNAGERLAFIKDNPDGSWDLSVFDISLRDS